MKLTSSKEILIKKRMLETNASPVPVRTIGLLELLGSIGIIVPYITGVATILTSLAAMGFGLIMVGALRSTS